MPIGCGPQYKRRPEFGGFFSEILNVAGSVVGDPALGDQIASKATPGFTKITQSQQQIAQTIAPDVIAAIKNPGNMKIDPAYQSLAVSVAPSVAQELAAQGVMFPPGSLGATYQNPSVFDAFGGQHEQLVKIGAGLLAAFAVGKVLKVF